MIKIVLKDNYQLPLLANVSFDNVKDWASYGTDPGDWLAVDDYIVPVDQIRYIVDMGDDNDEEQD